MYHTPMINAPHIPYTNHPRRELGADRLGPSRSRHSHAHRTKNKIPPASSVAASKLAPAAQLPFPLHRDCHRNAPGLPRELHRYATGVAPFVYRNATRMLQMGPHCLTASYERETMAFPFVSPSATNVRPLVSPLSYERETTVSPWSHLSATNARPLSHLGLSPQLRTPHHCLALVLRYCLELRQHLLRKQFQGVQGLFFG